MSGDRATALAGSITGNGWVAPGLGAGGSMAALDATMRPGDALGSAGLGWLTALVKPLQEVLDRMAGKASVIQSFADAWQKVSGGVNEIHQQLARSARSDTERWRGASGDRYRGRATEITSALQRIAALAAAASAATTTMGHAVAGGRQQAGDLITDLVQRLISFAAQAIAADGGVTSNVLSQATNLINSYKAPVAAIEQQLRQTIGNVAPLLTALANAMNGTPETPSEPATAPSAASRPVQVASLGPVALPSDATPPGAGAPFPSAAGRFGWGVVATKTSPEKAPPPDTLSDYFDNLDTAGQNKSVEDVQNSANYAPDALPLSEANAKAALRSGPAGAYPTVSGFSGEPVITFRTPHEDAPGAPMMVRDVLSINPQTSGVNDAATDFGEAMKRLALLPPHVPRELWVQVPDNATTNNVHALLDRFKQRPPGYEMVDVVFRHENGDLLAKVSRPGLRY